MDGQPHMRVHKRRRSPAHPSSHSGSVARLAVLALALQLSPVPEHGGMGLVPRGPGSRPHPYELSVLYQIVQLLSACFLILIIATTLSPASEVTLRTK